MISSNRISSTAKGSESGGNGDLQLPQRPVLAKYFAGIRLFWPQWLQARITGMQDLHHTNRRRSLDAWEVSEVYSSKSKIRKARSHSFVAACLV
jgi:hypothetical protein